MSIALGSPKEGQGSWTTAHTCKEKAFGLRQLSLSLTHSLFFHFTATYMNGPNAHHAYKWSGLVPYPVQCSPQVRVGLGTRLDDGTSSPVTVYGSN